MSIGSERDLEGLKAADQLLSLAKPPTAIFASNDDMGAATVAVAHRHHLPSPAQGHGKE